MNIVMANGTGKVASVDVRDVDLKEHEGNGTWSGYQHLAPVPAGEEHWYAWTWTGAVGLTFTDALGHRYTAVCSEFGTRVVDGFELRHPRLSSLSYPRRVGAPAEVRSRPEPEAL